MVSHANLRHRHSEKARHMLRRSGHKMSTGGPATSEAGTIKDPYTKPQLAKPMGLKRGGRVGGMAGHHRGDRKSRGAKHHTTVNVMVPPAGGGAPPGAGGPDPATAFKAGLMKGAMAAKAQMGGGPGGPGGPPPGGPMGAPPGGPPMPPPGAGPGGPPPGAGAGGPPPMQPPMARGGRACFKRGGRIAKKDGGSTEAPDTSGDDGSSPAELAAQMALAKRNGTSGKMIQSLDPGYKRGGRMKLDAAFRELKANPPKILAKTAANEGAGMANKQRVAIAMSKAGMAKKSGGRVNGLGLTKAMDDGAGGGEGRLEKTAYYKGTKRGMT